MNWFTARLRALNAQITWQKLARSVLVCLPGIILFLASGDKAWLTAALVTMCCMIVEERLDLAPAGILLHGVAILAGYILLVALFPLQWLFILACAALAAGTVSLALKGRELRALGIYTFIPALYLACATVEGMPPGAAMLYAVRNLPFLAVAPLPVVALAVFRHPPRLQNLHLAVSHHALWRLGYQSEFGDRLKVAETALACALAVALAAFLVEWYKLDEGQWIIWSAVSVVNVEAGTEHRKLRARAGGALIGVPLGIASGMLVPHTPAAYGLSVLAALLTLVAFRSYIVGYATRCAFIALAITIANQSLFIAAARVVNVILGGAIGLVCALAARRLHKLCR